MKHTKWFKESCGFESYQVLLAFVGCLCYLFVPQYVDMLELMCYSTLVELWLEPFLAPVELAEENKCQYALR